MRIITANLNGIRSASNKGFFEWMREQAAESLDHAIQAGEEVTTLGGTVSLGIGKLVGSHHTRVDQMMEEKLVHERDGIALYHSLHEFSAGRLIPLEEFARQMVRNEEPPRR